MKAIALDDGDTVALTYGNGKIYISPHQSGGFLILGDRNFLIETRAENSIRIIPELRAVVAAKEKL